MKVILSFMENLFYPLLILLLMITWSCLHSWLAAFSTKDRIYQLFGEGFQHFYRLFYVLIAIITLLPILAMVVVLPSHTLWIIPPPWLYLTLFIQLLSFIGLVITVFQVDGMAFIGLRQLVQPDVEEQEALVTRGFYKFTRHPLYLFSMIIFWLFPLMTDLILAFVIASSLYFIIGTIPEENKLIARYGQAYRDYQAKTPRIIPGIKF